jgi:hypothetical protein
MLETVLRVRRDGATARRVGKYRGSLPAWVCGHSCSELAMGEIDEMWARAEAARRRAVEVVERSVRLAEEHARRLEAAGDVEGAAREWAYARKGWAAVTRARGRR